MIRLEKLEACQVTHDGACNSYRILVGDLELRKDGVFYSKTGNMHHFESLWPDRNSADLFLDYTTSMERIAEKALRGEEIKLDTSKPLPSALEEHGEEVLESMEKSRQYFEETRKRATAEKDKKLHEGVVAAARILAANQLVTKVESIDMGRGVDGSAADPKGAEGAKKTPLQYLPLPALGPVSHVMKLGADKYGERNWTQSKGVEINTYKGAMLRHLTAFCEGEDIDPESGQSHLAHIAASCLILLDADMSDKLIDNRVIVKKP